ncbi:MAG: SLBB domain-containing protein, partial [Acidobacteriota bacterium]|nr:SLBB domain-containing protein [Acidobacteriota bacterium]
LPHVGEVGLAGRTSSEAASVIATSLERFLQKASVTVEILEYMSRPITVIGAVRKPGRLPFSGRWTLIEALTEAGGLTESAGDAITVRRQARNGLSDQLTVSARDLFHKMDPAVNVPVYANDLISVSSAYTVTVYCIGEVRSPGAQVFRSTEHISVISAISKAGGPTENASGKIIVTRAGGNGQFELRYKSILAGKDNDVPLEDGDVIEVKESFF